MKKINPKNGWSHNVFPTPVEILEAQIETILSIGIDAMKTGMLGSVEIIELVARKIDELKLDKVVIERMMYICLPMTKLVRSILPRTRIQKMLA